MLDHILRQLVALPCGRKETYKRMLGWEDSI